MAALGLPEGGADASAAWRRGWECSPVARYFERLELLRGFGPEPARFCGVIEVLEARGLAVQHDLACDAEAAAAAEDDGAEEDDEDAGVVPICNDVAAQAAGSPRRIPRNSCAVLDVPEVRRFVFSFPGGIATRRPCIEFMFI